jgi:hypothetical protein
VQFSKEKVLAHNPRDLNSRHISGNMMFKFIIM